MAKPSPSATNSSDHIDNSGFCVIISAPAFAATIMQRAAANPAPIIVKEPIRRGHADSGIIPFSPPNISTIMNKRSTIIKKAPKELSNMPHIELFFSTSAEAFMVLPCIKHHAATTRVIPTVTAIGKEDSIVLNSFGTMTYGHPRLNLLLKDLNFACL